MTPMDPDLIPAINESLQMALPEKISLDELKESLSVYINHLIQSDFEKLISLLYRIDVNESRLKNMLTQNKEENAGSMIAELIIERQLQKIKSRRENNKRNENFSGEERW